MSWSNGSGSEQDINIRHRIHGVKELRIRCNRRICAGRIPQWLKLVKIGEIDHSGPDMLRDLETLFRGSAYPLRTNKRYRYHRAITILPSSLTEVFKVIQPYRTESIPDFPKRQYLHYANRTSSALGHLSTWSTPKNHICQSPAEQIVGTVAMINRLECQST